MASPEQGTKFRFTFLMLAAAVVCVLCCYAYSLWLTSQEQNALLPRLAADQIIKALRSYHHQAGRFPENLVELEARVWKHSRPPEFGEDGRSVSVSNYYYIYYAVDATNCTLWAIPINKHREEGSTFFLALNTETIRRWKGAPLALAEIKQLPSVPTTGQLALLGLTEQPPLPTKRPRTWVR
jgi:hypothetical protein